MCTCKDKSVNRPREMAHTTVSDIHDGHILMFPKRKLRTKKYREITDADAVEYLGNYRNGICAAVHIWYIQCFPHFVHNHVHAA